jgi:hypothetical protein
MLYPYTNLSVSTSENTVAIQANVPAVVNAIKTNSVIPYGDYGGASVYYFSTMDNGLGNIVYTVFDKTTNLGLASFMVRYGAATTIQQILFQQFPRSQIDLQFLILPKIPVASKANGTVIPY